MRRLLPVILIFAAAGLSTFAATYAADVVERTTRAEVAKALRDTHGWVRYRVDGLRVVLSGTAPDEASRFGAISAVGSIVDGTRIVDRIEVTPAAEVEAPEFSVEILRNVDGISLIGLIPAETDRAAILDRLGRVSGAPVTDLLESGDYPAPPTWEAALDYALAALARMPRSKVSVTASRVAVNGIVGSAEEKRRLETDLARAAPEGVRLALDIAAPRPVIAPFTVRFVLDAGGARFDACAADTDEARRRILSAAGKVGLKARVQCPIGLGAPSREWAAAVEAGIAAAGRLGSAKFTLADADASLVVPHDVAGEIFEEVVGDLEAALPPGFSLTASQTPPPDAETVAEAETSTPEFRAILSDSGAVELRGRLPDERAQTAVESYAHGLFGVETTKSATRVAEGLPDGWALHAMAALDALGWLVEGEVRLRPGLLSVRGVTGREEAQSEIAGLLGERLEDGSNFEIDVRYDPAEDPEAGLPTPEECVARLRTVQEVQKVTFEPGSSTIDAEGLEIIDQLAEILRDCPAVPMEIAGHTDSQGREEMNLELSQARADAVLTALMARRVLTSSLTAVGYGETEPIADNGTEEGREANRRIEFRLLEDADPAAEGTDEETGEVAEQDGEGAGDGQN